MSTTVGFSDFYMKYVRNIQQIISANATAEVSPLPFSLIMMLIPP